eukprot:134400-Rhodomonas_salina.1
MVGAGTPDTGGAGVVIGSDVVVTVGPSTTTRSGCGHEVAASTLDTLDRKAASSAWAAIWVPSDSERHRTSRFTVVDARSRLFGSCTETPTNRTRSSSMPSESATAASREASIPSEMGPSSANTSSMLTNSGSLTRNSAASAADAVLCPHEIPFTVALASRNTIALVPKLVSPSHVGSAPSVLTLMYAPCPVISTNTYPANHPSASAADRLASIGGAGM